MTTIILGILIICSVSSMAMLAGQYLASRNSGLSRQLAEVRASAVGSGAVAQRRRAERLGRLQRVLEVIGQRFEGNRPDASQLRTTLMHAGYVDPRATTFFWASRAVVAAGLFLLALFISPLAGFDGSQAVAVMIAGLGIGWVLPSFYVGKRVRARQLEMQKALPDLLDMLMVCVEAGLGLNQAMIRTASEIQAVSPVLAEQVALVNLEIRAGTPRVDALRNLSERTGVVDIRTLVGIMVQTEKFGTSIANALRVQSDSLRTKRRQRAEEAAAKTTIKLVFPLALFIFPAMFVVILGPVILAAIATFGPGGSAR